MRDLKYKAPRVDDPKKRVLKYLQKANLDKVTRDQLIEKCGITCWAISRMGLSKLIDQERKRRYEERQYRGRTAMIKLLGYTKFSSFDEWHLRQYGKRWSEIYLIHTCTQDDIRAIVKLRSAGLNLTGIETKSGYARASLRKFLQAYDNFGEGCFVPREMAS